MLHPSQAQPAVQDHPHLHLAEAAIIQAIQCTHQRRMHHRFITTDLSEAQSAQITLLRSRLVATDTQQGQAVLEEQEQAARRRVQWDHRPYLQAKPTHFTTLQVETVGPE